MKRIVYFSITIVSLFLGVILFYMKQSSIKHETDDRMRIIVNLDTGIIPDNTLITQTSNIMQENIRELFIRFNVKEIQAVYRNRYNEKGNLKLCTNTESTGTWQQIIMNDYSRATKFINLLKKENNVLNAYIERPLLFKPCVAPNDAQYLNQWHLNSISYPMADIRAEQAWDINKGRSDVIIAVCDGGVDYTHPDLDPGDRSRVIAGYDSGNDDNDPMDDLPTDEKLSFGGHGTHVAGIIGAITNNGNANNGKNVAGVMWNCKIMPVKMVGNGSFTISYPFGSTNWDFSTTAFPSDVADAIDYAVNNGAHVINLSYGFDSMGGLLNDVILRVPLLYQAILNAYNHNVVVVAAMGNEYNNGNPIEFPAFFRIVIAVGATTNSNPPSRVSSSSTGSHICVSAPGDGIISTLHGGGIGSKSGTSMAAPIVSGVAGLIISQGLDRNFNLTNDDVRHIIERTADDITSTGIGFDNETGYGKVNAYRALSLLNTPNVLYHGVSIGGTSVKLSTLSKWIYYGPQWGLASDMYYNVDQYQITKHITFDVPFCSVPQVWMRDRESTCLGFGNPNDGYPYVIITNITNIGFDVKYATYYVRYNSLGQTFNRWVPVEPTSTQIAYTAVGQPNLAGTAGPISGPTVVCSSYAAFTVNNLPNGATVIWNKSSNLNRISNQGANPCNFSATGSGEGWIEATIPSTGCGDVILPRKNVWIGNPSTPTNITGFYSDGISFGQDQVYEFSVDPLINQNVTNYQWVVGGGTILSGQGTNVITIRTAKNPNGNITYFDLDVRFGNLCGWSSYFMRSGFIESGVGPINRPIKLMLSPNPSSNIVEVTITKDAVYSNSMQSETSANDIEYTNYTIRIFNSLSTLVYTTTRTGNNFTVPVSNLRNGNYFIEVTDRKNNYRQQLIIKHD